MQRECGSCNRLEKGRVMGGERDYYHSHLRDGGCYFCAQHSVNLPTFARSSPVAASAPQFVHHFAILHQTERKERVNSEAANDRHY